MVSIVTSCFKRIRLEDMAMRTNAVCMYHMTGFSEIWDKKDAWESKLWSVIEILPHLK